MSHLGNCEQKLQVHVCLDLNHLFQNSEAGEEGRVQERHQHLWQQPSGPDDADSVTEARLLWRIQIEEPIVN